MMPVLRPLSIARWRSSHHEARGTLRFVFVGCREGRSDRMMGMENAIGVLSMNGLKRWEILREGRQAYELSSGSVFLLEVDGVLRRTSIEFRHFTGRHPKGLAGEYYSPDGYHLAGGLRAAPPGDAEDGQ